MATVSCGPGPEDAAALSADLRRLGLDRVVFGSDYPVFDPGSYAELFRTRLALETGDPTLLLGNRLPGLFGDPPSGTGK